MTAADTNEFTNGTITTPPFFGMRARIESGTLRGWSTSARDAECEKITGACGHVERGAHRARRHVRQIDEHAEPVHLAHDLAAERREPVVLRAVERGVGPVERHVVGERHVARAHVVVEPQERQRVLDRVAALEAEERRDLPRLTLPLARASAVGAHCELGILRDHAPRDVDLLELDAGVARRARHRALRLVHRLARLAGDVDRPELRADVTRLEAREVGHARRSLAEIVRLDVHRMHGVFADAPRKIVVAVHHRRGAQHAKGARHVRIGGRLAHRRAHGQERPRRGARNVERVTQFGA